MGGPRKDACLTALHPKFSLIWAAGTSFGEAFPPILMGSLGG